MSYCHCNTQNSLKFNGIGRYYVTFDGTALNTVQNTGKVSNKSSLRFFISYNYAKKTLLLKYNMKN